MTICCDFNIFLVVGPYLQMIESSCPRTSAGFSKTSARERSLTKQYLWRQFLLFSRRTFAGARFAERSTGLLLLFDMVFIFIVYLNKHQNIFKSIPTSTLSWLGKTNLTDLLCSTMNVCSLERWHTKHGVTQYFWFTVEMFFVLDFFMFDECMIGNNYCIVYLYT